MQEAWLKDLEQEAERIAERISDEKLKKMFVECYLCTARTTLKPMQDGSVFVITGDIPAMWLRDSAAQVHHYLPLTCRSEAVYRLVSGVIAKQFFYIGLDAYGNAFNETANGAHFAEDNSGQTAWNWERKYEADSLCFPIDLAWQLWKFSGHTDHLTEAVHEGLQRVISLWQLEQRHEENSQYRFMRDTNSPTETLVRNGLGTPTAYTGMTWSGFRCSDDACTYGYNIPANMYASVVLKHAAELAEKVFLDGRLADAARALSEQIHDGIKQFGIVDTPDFGPIYCYETDGLGNHVLIDDAGSPGLMNAPYIGFTDQSDEIYRNTRRFSLSCANPFYYEGSKLTGLGSPHTEPGRVWPMAIIMQAMTCAPNEDVDALIAMVRDADDGTFHVHEGVDKDDPSKYTRLWFAWVDSLFAELLMRCAGEIKPLH